VNAYTFLRLVHSYWRWLVVATALVALVRALAGVVLRRHWSRGDERAAVAFVGAVDMQVLIGLVLYFAFSPYWTAAHTALVAALHDRVTRFFAVEHESAMLLAFVAAHLGRVLSRRQQQGPAKHRVMLITLVIFWLLIGWAIPWPWRAVGRPLLRLVL
jgi:hypothetical protein